MYLLLRQRQVVPSARMFTQQEDIAYKNDTIVSMRRLDFDKSRLQTRLEKEQERLESALKDVARLEAKIKSRVCVCLSTRQIR